MLVGVAHHKPDGCAGCHTVEHTTQYFNLIGFLTSCSDLALTGATSRKLVLNEVHIHRDARWHTIYYTSHCLTMTLTKRCEGEYFSERVAHTLYYFVLL